MLDHPGGAFSEAHWGHVGLWIAGISRCGSGFYCRGTLVARFYVLNFIIIIFAILIIILVCRGYSFGFVTEGVKNPSNGWFLAKLMEKGVLTPLNRIFPLTGCIHDWDF